MTYSSGIPWTTTLFTYNVSVAAQASRYLVDVVDDIARQEEVERHQM